MNGLRYAPTPVVITLEFLYAPYSSTKRSYDFQARQLESVLQHILGNIELVRIDDPDSDGRGPIAKYHIFIERKGGMKVGVQSLFGAILPLITANKFQDYAPDFLLLTQPIIDYGPDDEIAMDTSSDDETYVF